MAFNFKTASKEELKAEYNRIAAEIGDDQFFTKKELAHLPEVLIDGEQVLAFTSGLMDNNTWLIALTDQRMILLDKGLLYGLKQTEFWLDKVYAVTCKTGLIFGTLEVQVSSDNKVIKNVPKKAAAAFAAKAREAMEAARRASTAEAKTEPEDDVVSKLERLAALKERGVLSEEEFQAQKAKLLA